MTNYMQLGLKAAQARNAAEALGWFQRAHEQDPADAQARAWLGQSLCAVGQRLDGVAHLRGAGAQLLKAAGASGDLTKVFEVISRLHGWSDFAGALELARGAVALNPNHPQAQQLLAVTCGQLNLTEEGLAAVRAAAALAPGHPMLAVFQASLEADAKRYPEARARLESVLAAAPPAREAHRAHKELARVLDAQGEYGAVFSHLETAGALALTLPEYTAQDPRLIPAMVSTNAAGFTSGLLGRWAGQAFADGRSAPVFVMGFFRSGTTLTQEALDVHPDVFVADEAGLLWQVQRELQQMDPSNSSLAEKLGRLDLAGITRLRQAYWRAARGRYGADAEARVFVDKFTMNTVDVGLINCIFPEAKVVFVLRDPRDVCVSCFMQLMVPTPSTRHLLTWRDTAAFYALVMGWWVEIRQHLTLDVLEFRYEDAVSGFEQTFREVFAFLDLAWDPEVLNFHAHAVGKFIASPSRNQVAQPLYSSSVARWRRYEQDVATVSGVLDPFIDRFRYR